MPLLSLTKFELLRFFFLGPWNPIFCHDTYLDKSAFKRTTFWFSLISAVPQQECQESLLYCLLHFDCEHPWAFTSDAHTRAGQSQDSSVGLSLSVSFSFSQYLSVVNLNKKEMLLLSVLIFSDCLFDFHVAFCWISYLNWNVGYKYCFESVNYSLHELQQMLSCFPCGNTFFITCNFASLVAWNCQSRKGIRSIRLGPLSFTEENPRLHVYCNWVSLGIRCDFA